MGRLSKEEFVETIDRIKTIIDFQSEVDKVFDKYWCESPSFVDSIDILIHNLNVMFDLDETDTYGSDIDYFVFDLEFGENPNNLEIRDENGNKITLSSAEDLYDFITRE